METTLKINMTTPTIYNIGYYLYIYIHTMYSLLILSNQCSLYIYVYTIYTRDYNINPRVYWSFRVFKTNYECKYCFDDQTTLKITSTYGTLNIT